MLEIYTVEDNKIIRLQLFCYQKGIYLLSKKEGIYLIANVFFW